MKAPIFFLIRVQGLSRRCRREPHPLYIAQVERTGYSVTGFKTTTKKGEAKIWGKLEAELLAKSIRNWKGRRPNVVEVEPATKEASAKKAKELATGKSIGKLRAAQMLEAAQASALELGYLL